MRPEEYLLIIARRWWLVVLAIVVAAGVAYIYSNAEPKTYQVSTSLMAIAEPPDYWMDLYAKNRLASYKDLIGNWDFVAGALIDAGSAIDPGQAMSGLALSHNPDSNTVQIVVTDTDPGRAAEVVNALADAFVARSEAENEQITRVYSEASTGERRGTVELIKLGTPGPPETPIGPRVKLNTAAAALLGLVFGVMMAFVLEYLDDTLRTAGDVDRYLDLPTIAGIPRG